MEMLGAPSGLSHAMEMPRTRRGPLQRSDTAPEELEMERRLEAEWRRRKFVRASSADRPSSANPPRSPFTLPAAYSERSSYSALSDTMGDCSASCPPTVPATPTRSPRPPLRGPPLTPPPPPARVHSPERLERFERLGRLERMDRFGGSGIVGPGGGGGFQCECMEDREAWRWEPGVFDMWCAPCTKRRRPSTRWSSFDLSSMPHHGISSSALLTNTPDHDSLGGSRLNIGGSRLNMSASRLNMNDSLMRGPPPPPSIWDCLVSCHSRMGQRLARKRVEQGVRLYNQQKHLAAVKKWRQALRRIRKDNDRFITLGYLAQAHIDWGRYRELLDYGFQQLDIANELDSPMLRAEAYLTLARGNERLGNLEKALSYCRHSLYNQCDQSKVTGNVHYTLGNIYATFSAFCKALEHYELSLKVSRVIHDTALELQVYCGLSACFCYLQDFEKALSFGSKALELSKTFNITEFSSKYERMALLCLATPLRKLSRIHEARDCCQDALKLAFAANDRPSNARCLLILADIHRQCLDVQRSYKRYEACMTLMNNMEDKYGQLLALNGIAKVLGVMRRQSRICDCRPLDINNKVVNLASGIGCKLLMRSAHGRLGDIYRILRDEENERLQMRLANCLTEEMELVCGVCRDPIADTPGNALDALPCSHIFHSKCVRDLMTTGDRKKKKRICPDCRKSLNSRLMLICYDELKSTYGGNTGTCTDGTYNTGTCNAMIGGLKNASSANLIPPSSGLRRSSSIYGHFRSVSPSEDEQPL